MRFIAHLTIPRTLSPRGQPKSFVRLLAALADPPRTQIPRPEALVRAEAVRGRESAKVHQIARRSSARIRGVGPRGSALRDRRRGPHGTGVLPIEGNSMLSDGRNILGERSHLPALELSRSR